MQNRKTTNFDIYSDIFQEDEAQIYSMIESKYKHQLQAISEERRQSILVDVRSIIMIYRERKGQTATRIQSSRDILLTLNGTIANVSKDYESNRSINSGNYIISGISRADYDYRLIEKKLDNKNFTEYNNFLKLRTVFYLEKYIKEKKYNDIVLNSKEEIKNFLKGQKNPSVDNLKDEIKRLEEKIKKLEKESYD